MATNFGVFRTLVGGGGHKWHLLVIGGLMQHSSLIPNKCCAMLADSSNNKTDSVMMRDGG